MPEHPDWQDLVDWFGTPLDQATALAVGAGTVTRAAQVISHFQGVLILVKPTGGSVTVTLSWSTPNIPASLVPTNSFVGPAASVTSASYPVIGSQLTVALTGTAGGETVDYACIPTNTITQTSTVSGPTVLIAPTLLANWPPASPVDGQLAVLQLPASYDPVGGKLLRWLLSYDLTNAQWDFCGGPPLYVEVVTSETTTSVAYTDLATVGPSVVIPRAGDYLVEPGAVITPTGNSSGTAFMAYSGAGVTAADADAAQASSSTSSGGGSVSKARYKAGLTAATVTAKYKGNANISTFSNRTIRVTPVRIS